MALRFLNNGYFAGSVGIGTNTFSTGRVVISQSGGTQLHLISPTDTSGSVEVTLRLTSSIDYRGRGIQFDNSDAAGKWFTGVPYQGGAYSIGYHATQPEYRANSKLFINTSGDVGIGTDGPVGKLTVQGDDADIYLRSNDYTIARLINRGSTGVNLDTGLFSLFVQNTENVRIDAGGTSWFNGGNVGIGTTTPQQKLDVVGRVRASYNTSNYYEIGASSAGGFVVGKSGGVETVNIRTYGDSHFNGGNFGIGTASPSEKLEVAGNIKITAALLSNQENTDVDTGTETVASVAIATYTAAFFDFVIKKTTNVRSGTVYACHDGTSVAFTETSTQDLGDTSDVTLSVDISGTNMRLRATTTSDDWSIKSLIRAI